MFNINIMASLDGLTTRKLLAKGVIGQVADDGAVLMTLKYIGTGSVTSVTVTTATDIALATSVSTKTYTWASYTTMGALVAAINADGFFEAKILDAIASTATGAGLAVTGAITASNGVWNMLSDTSGASYLGYRLSYDRTFGVNQKLRNGHRVNLQEIVYNVTLGAGADANGLKIYSSINGVDTLVYQATPTSGAATTLNWASGNAKITGSEGADLVVIIEDATSVTGKITVAGELE